MPIGRARRHGYAELAFFSGSRSHPECEALLGCVCGLVKAVLRRQRVRSGGR
jgi:hypothetical protein